MLEPAVGNSNVPSRTPDPNATWVHLRAEAPGPGAEIPRRRSDIPGRRGEAKRQTGNVDVLDLLAVHQVHLLARLDLQAVGIPIARRPQIKPPSGPLLLKPIFAFSIVEILRLVLQVIAHVTHDDTARAAARPAPKTQAVLLQVPPFHLFGVGGAHDPAGIRPDQR